ncbi:muramidase [Borrelia sp. A-FGy1]|uniref:rod-binding protein n=1 Tax=Borrelia sp. A-FGy1 TaxID=2608247 RepID=UPI0015F74803|nr:rod-binding protein [Borrelia sp. A-FGy1]QMU99517.1 muramidase [Borrelia sp. A-FGy1]
MIDKSNLLYMKTKNQINQIRNLKNKSEQANKNKNDLYNVSLEFETIFINQIFKSMRSSLKKENNIINGGQAEEIFEDMLYLEKARQISKSKNFGLATLIYNQISKK